MNLQRWIDPRVQELRPADVQAYLLAHGWKSVPFPGPELLVFAGPLNDEGKPILQVVPSSEKYRDFRMRVEELLGALSVLEDRHPTAILDDMLGQRGNNRRGQARRSRGKATGPAAAAGD